MFAKFSLGFPAVPNGNETAGIKHSKNEFKIPRNQQLSMQNRAYSEILLEMQCSAVCRIGAKELSNQVDVQLEVVWQTCFSVWVVFCQELEASSGSALPSRKESVGLEVQSSNEIVLIWKECFTKILFSSQHSL